MWGCCDYVKPCGSPFVLTFRSQGMPAYGDIHENLIPITVLLKQESCRMNDFSQGSNMTSKRLRQEYLLHVS